ncbi:MAG TPA: hypothetical protein VGO84_13865 [Burkholderiales bacterium]|nr:hypothetical protein [Burkholderiales bacterium]
MNANSQRPGGGTKDSNDTAKDSRQPRDTQPSDYEPPFPQPDEASKEGFTHGPADADKAHNTKPKPPM